MHLVNSANAPLVLAIFLGLAALIILGQIRRARLVRSIFSESQRTLLLSNYSPSARAIRLTCLALALFLVCFAVLDPRWGSRTTEKEMEGIDVVFVMDISASMIRRTSRPRGSATPRSCPNSS
jgi:Ca-activated chloride channel family protein